MRRINTKVVISGTSMPVVRRSTVTTILGRDSFLKRLIASEIFLFVAACHASGDLHDGIVVNAAIRIDLLQNFLQ